MPGIVGLVSPRPLKDLDHVLASMTEALRPFPWHQTETFVAPDHRFALGRVHLGILPVESTPNRWLHGEETDGFTRVELDEAARVLTIGNDRFGLMPLFWTHTADTLLFATELKALLAHPGVPRRLDERGLADLLAFGFILGERTLGRGCYRAEGVRALVERHMSGQADCGAAILLLMTLEWWQRLFLDGETWKAGQTWTPAEHVAS